MFPANAAHSGELCWIINQGPGSNCPETQELALRAGKCYAIACIRQNFRCYLKQAVLEEGGRCLVQWEYQVFSGGGNHVSAFTILAVR